MCLSPISLGTTGRTESMVKAFDKVGLRARLWKEEEVPALPITPQPNMAGLPELSQTNVTGEDLSGTIPWQNTNQDRGEGEGRQTTASNPSHAVVEIAHHHHLHLPPAPAAQLHLSPHHCHGTSPLPGLLYSDDCARVSFFPDESRRPLPTASYRTMACPEGQAAASSASCSQRPVEETLPKSSEEEEEEKRFNSGLARLVARAELHRKQGQHHHCGGSI